MEPTAEQTGSLQYCAELLKAGDEDRWLTTQFAPEAACARLSALFAFYREIERIPHAVTEPPLGEIRLQWWREAIDEIVKDKTPRAHPVVSAMAASGLCEPGAIELLSGMIDARARLLYDEPFASLDDLTRWFDATEGALAVVAARVWESAHRASVSGAGVAYGLARHGAALAPSLNREIKPYANHALESARGGLADLDDEAAACLRYVSLARRYLAADRPPSPLSKRLRLFWATAAGRLAD
ncbi:MAG: squalene/phytoene synthase family protein [Pseudomonadota bacterium]|nr:squalene/phytoene synthase family protein [Pseudomonadota bacterium]